VILCAYILHVTPVSAAAAWSVFVLSFCQACTVPTFTEYLFAGMRPFLCSVKLLVLCSVKLLVLCSVKLLVV